MSGASSSSTPEWLFPLLQTKFNTSRSNNSVAKNHIFFCMTCSKTEAIREIDKCKHPGHEFIQAFKASKHFAVRDVHINSRLDCQHVAVFSINGNNIFYLNCRDLKGEGKKKCVHCGCGLSDRDDTALYCSLACKFKCKEEDEDLIQERRPVVDLEQEGSVSEIVGVEKEVDSMKKCSFTKHRRKGIPHRAPMSGYCFEFY